MERDVNKATARMIDIAIFTQLTETTRINAQPKWYPFAGVTGIFAAAIALVKYVV